ncbi:MAG: Na+/H+ antiporter NhaC family protein [Acidobacteriota bacterium]
MAQPETAGLSFRGGALGAIAPLLLFLAGVVWLGLSGAPAEAGFWPILVAALTLGLLLCRERHAYAESVIEGTSQSIVMVMVMAWLLAGMLGEVMKETGFVEALVWLAHSAGVGDVGWILTSFLIASVVSTSTGTSLGTIVLCAPLLYPAGGALGANPAVLMGAILGGATFGDNISPVSDTTIASTVTQGARMGDVVRSRLRYALPAALMAMVAYAWFAAGRGGDAEALSDPSIYSPEGLPMVAAPLLVVVLLFRHHHLLEGLLYGVLAAVVIGLGFGLVTPSELFFPNAATYSAEGALVVGMRRGVGVSIFTVLLMGLVATLEASGVLGRLLSVAERRIHSPRSAEWWAFGTVSAATLATTHSVVALLTVGRFVRETGARQGIDPRRRANILDVTVCTYPFLLPYCIPTMLAASTTSSGPAFGMPVLTPFEIGLVNFHSWALLAVVLLAILTGWGRRLVPAAEPEEATPDSDHTVVIAASDVPDPSPSVFDETERIQVDGLGVGGSDGGSTDGDSRGGGA